MTLNRKLTDRMGVNGVQGGCSWYPSCVLSIHSPAKPSSCLSWCTRSCTTSTSASSPVSCSPSLSRPPTCESLCSPPHGPSSPIPPPSSFVTHHITPPPPLFPLPSLLIHPTPPPASPPPPHHHHTNTSHQHLAVTSGTPPPPQSLPRPIPAMTVLKWCVSIVQMAQHSVYV